MSPYSFIPTERQAEALVAFTQRTGMSKSDAIRQALDFWPRLWISGQVSIYAVVLTCSGSVKLGG